jgi:glycosylphosphatidylinositol transamidase (GPIT) subunit GPI8
MPSVVLMRDGKALVFINGHWQGMSYALAFTEAKLMTKDDFHKAFGTIADHHRQTLGR